MKHLVLIFLTISLVFASQYVPIPKREVGIFIGNPNADVKIDLIYDPSCDGTADFDLTFRQALALLSDEELSRISTRFISLPLPYHIAAQKQTQAIVFVQKNKGNAEALQLFRDFLTNLDQYSEEALKNVSVNGLMLKIAQRINTLFGLKTEDALKELLHGSSSDATTRQWSKNVMGAIKAAGTPRIRINGVIVD